MTVFDENFFKTIRETNFLIYVIDGDIKPPLPPHVAAVMLTLGIMWRLGPLGSYMAQDSFRGSCITSDCILGYFRTDYGRKNRFLAGLGYNKDPSLNF